VLVVAGPDQRGEDREGQEREGGGEDVGEIDHHDMVAAVPMWSLRICVTAAKSRHQVTSSLRSLLRPVNHSERPGGR
jgi:hypothetical protein